MARFNEDFAMCKGPYRHQWEPYNPLPHEVAPRIKACPHHIYAWCTRCTAARHWGLDSNMDVIKSDYIYPDGYREAQDERLSTRDMRLVVIKRRGIKGAR